METFGQLKNEVGQVLKKLNNHQITKFYEQVECQIEDTSTMFNAGITWNELADIPDDSILTKIIPQCPILNKKSYIPVKAKAVDGKVFLIVKEIN